MTTKVEKSVLVNVPVSTAYNQWTQFEEFPHFMGGVKSVTQLGDSRLQWVAEIAGIKRQWEATILEQVADQKVAWAATEGATNAGQVRFEDLGGGQCRVHLTLDYEPEGVVEKVGDKLNIVEKQAEGDLERFKTFIEDEGYATGAWRGSVNEGALVGKPNVQDAAASEGDKGKAGVSLKAAAVGVGIVAAAAGVAAARGGKSDSTDADVSVTEADMPSGQTNVTVVEESVTVVPVDTTSSSTAPSVVPSTTVDDELEGRDPGPGRGI